MTKKRQICLTRLLTLLLAAVLVWGAALPAWAEEGDNGGYSDMQPSGDGEGPGGEDPPGEDPTPEPGGEDPTPEPGGEDPTPEPGGEDPTPEPGGEDPTPEPGGEDPTPEPGGEDPTPEPGDDPVSSEPQDTPPPYEPSGDGNGDTSSRNESSSSWSGPSATRAPNSGTGGTIRQPAALNPRDATPSPNPSGSPGPTQEGPNYMTFAKVSQKNNSMSIVLFYGGAGFIGVGVLGLLTLIIFVIRGRRSVDERDGIFEEIQQAESRHRPPAPPPRPAPAQDLAQGYQERPPMVHRPDPEALSVPVNGNMYTEEFDPPIPAGQGMYTEEFVSPAPRGSQAPPQASMYTEEFVIPEDLPPVPQQVQPQPAQRPRPAPAPPPPARDSAQYDTVELLREILYTDDTDKN